MPGALMVLVSRHTGQGLAAALCGRAGPAALRALASSTPTLLQDLSSGIDARGLAAQAAASTASSRSASGSGASTTSGSSDARAWRSAVTTRFAIKPSVTSPLFATYKQNREVDQRRTLLLKLLEAHARLSRSIEGMDDEQARRIARYRITHLRSLTDDLNALLDDSHAPKTLTECTSRSQMYGFYSLLQNQANQADKQAREFAQLQAGRSAASVWDYWRKHFQEPYVKVPGLEPLHATAPTSTPRVSRTPRASARAASLAPSCALARAA